MKTVVSFSGGLDSTTCCLIAKERGDEVIAVSFDYGQRNRTELAAAKKIAKKLGLKHIILDAKFISKLAPNYLTMTENVLNENGKLPNTFVPGRNILFATMVGIVAYMNKADNIMMGVNAVDYSGYPDCRPEFVKAMHKAINLGLDTNINLETPLLKLSKGKIIEKASKLGYLDFVLENTVSCYNGIKGEGCGKCPSCKLRKMGYKEFMNSKDK